MKNVSIPATLALAVLCWAVSLFLASEKVVVHGLRLYLPFLVLSAVILVCSIALFIGKQDR